MARKERLSSNQLTMLVIILLIGTSVVIGTKGLGVAGKSAWAALLLATVGAVPLIIILEAAWLAFSFPFGEIIVLATFFSAVEKGQSIVKPFLKGLAVGATVYLLTVVRNLAVLGPELLKISSFSSAKVVRLIQVTGFIERVEAIIVIFWVLSIFMKAVIIYYAASLLATQIFSVKNKMIFWLFIISIAFLTDVYLINTQFLLIYISENVYQ